MSEIIKSAQAGTLESADILIMVSTAHPGDGLQIELVSPTMKQYGAMIRQTIEKVLQAKMEVTTPDKALFQKATEAVYKKFEAEIGKDLIDQVRGTKK